uniref:C2H2-type domain-containing protein n=1 Tax=Oryzias latipes TaxID=8090 RepID=A0A3P9MCW1_ORYLA
MTSVGDKAAGSMQGDCEGPEEAPEVLDHHYEPGMDPNLTQPEGEAPHPPQEQTPTERASNEDDARNSEKKEQKALQLVLNELLQQQKHRPGRRFKKKTLMKMAKLLVIARGWDGEAGPPVLNQEAPVGTGGTLLPDDITEAPDHSGMLDPSSAERQKSDKDEKSETGSGGHSIPDLQVASRSKMKIEEEETDGELQTSAASCLSGEAPTALEGMTSVGDKAAGSMQGDCEGPEEAPEVLDHPYEPGMDPNLTQPDGEAPHPPQEQTPTERASNEDDARNSEKKEQKALQLVLNELLQQQKHRPGRRFKKKTLMKMAKLLVIARGWDGEAGPPVLNQEAPVATGEDDLVETTAALNQQELYKEHLETQKEDLNLSQQASGASRTKEDKECWLTSSRSNREGLLTQTNEEQNPGTFRVLEAHRPRKGTKKASRTSKNKRAEPKPPEETSAEKQKTHHGAQTAVRLQSEEEVASAEQDEGLRGTVTILTLTKVRNKKQLDNVDGAEGHHGKKRRNSTVTKLAQTEPDAETLVAQRQNLQELPPGGAVLPGRTTVKSNRPKPRRRIADKAVPPPEGLLRERSPAEGSEQTRVQRTAAKMGKSKSRKHRAEPEFSALESFPEKKQHEVWFGSVSLKEEEGEQPIETIKKRRGRKRKEEWTEDKLQSSEPPTNKTAAAVTAGGGQPKPAVQGERKPRGRKKKIKLELPEERSEDISNMAAVEKTREEHLKTVKDLNSKTENCEHPASTMKKRWRKRKNSAADVTLSLPGPSIPPGDMSETLKEKTRKVPLDAAVADVPLVLCSSSLNPSLPADSVVKTKKKRGRRPKQPEATSQIPQTRPSLEFKDSNLNPKPPENAKKREQKSKMDKLSGQTPENTQIFKFKAIKQEYDDSVTSQLLCHTEEWAPPRRKPRRRRTSGIIRTVRKVKQPHTFRNLLPIDLSESGKKTDRLSGLGEGRVPNVNAPPKNHELLQQTMNSEVQSHLCSVCGRSFRHLSVLTLHRLIHADGKPLTRPPRKKRSLKPPQLSCPCCAAAFNSKTQLLLHLSHAESCTAQPQAGGQHRGDITAFAGHLPTHGRRRHSCPTCKKTFRSPAGLSLHRKVHTRTCTSTESFQDLDLRLLPETQSGPPETKSGPPVTQSGPPETQSGPPETQSGPPVTQSGPPESQLGPPETQSGALDTQSEKPLSEPKAGSVASVLFSCPTCRLLHPHWCHFVLHMRTHSTGWCRRCDVCSQQHSQDEEPPKHCSACCELSGEAETCRRMLSGSWKEAEPVRGECQHPEEEQTREGWEFSLGGGPDEGVDIQLSSPSPCSSASVEQVDVSHPSVNPKSNQGARQLFFRPQAILLRRFMCARWGRCFPHWSRLRVYRGLHQKPGKAFRCSNCELDFHFLGSYLRHLQEHAAQTPHGCAACPATFAEEHQLSSHVSECHGRRRCRTCSRCGKPFSSLLNLKKHELLHRGVRPYVCTRCQLPFSSSADLTAHLNVHEARLRVPEPTPLLEPLSFPYPCRKCNATFSSAELLQAHQVCHFTATRMSERPSESPASYLTRRILEDPQRSALESPQEPRPLPVSTRKHLFRYPHPDRLYVVPAPPSEPALLISDSEDEVGTSAEPGSSLEKPASSSRPQAKEVSEMDQLDLLIQSLIPERDFSESESCCESKAPPLLVSPQMDDMHSCAICTAAFTELSELHAHYMEHARIL